LLTRGITDTSAAASVRGVEVAVTNGAPYVGGECVLRVDKTLESGPLGNFITSRVPAGFADVSGDAYVLFGIWTAGPIHTLDDVNRFYEPGTMGRAHYVYRRDDQQSIVKISGSGVQRRALDLATIIANELPDASTYARVVLADLRSIVEVTQAVRQHGLVPVLMEPKVTGLLKMHWDTLASGGY
jgi:hypothetical protein